MKKIIARVVLCLAALVVCFVCPGIDPQSGKSEAAPRKVSSGFVPGRILVKFRDSTTTEQRGGLMATFGLREAGKIPNVGIHILELPESAGEEQLVRVFSGLADVEFAELDRIVEPAQVTPNDALYSEEWHLSQISAPSAWALTTGSGNIVIAILDTGVDSAHEDLAAKMVPGWNIYSNNSNTSDVQGHGTKVAGTAAAASNNALGVSSVAWGCKIMPIRIADSTGNATYSAMASGLNWAADHGARVANLSYIASTSSTVKSAAQYFQSKGGVVVSSAGNNSTFDSSPDNQYVLTVSSTDQSDVLSYWSNTGNNVDLAAPEGAYTTQMGGGYTYAGGTSISAPIVAGVAALVMSANPNLTGAQVQDILKSTADDLGPSGWDPSYGWGRINAQRAVAAAGGSADTIAPTINFLSPTAGSTVSGLVGVQVAATDNVGVSSVTLSVDGQVLGSMGSGPYVYQWDTNSLSNGQHDLTAIATDASGNSSTSLASVNVSNVPTADTDAPAVTITSPTSGSKLGANLQVTVAASDNVAVVKNELYIDGRLVASTTSAPFSIRWNTKKLATGSHALLCRAYDGAGNIGTSQSVTVYK